MKSAIGQHLDTSAVKRRVALSVGIGVVVADMLICTLPIGIEVRLSIALIAFAIYVCLCDGDLGSLGLRASPRQGWKPWIRISTTIVCGIMLCLIVGFGVLLLMGSKLPVYNHDPAFVPSLFLHMCVVAPVLEEVLYRVVVCLAFVRTIGCINTIVVNGVVFALLHFVYGNPSPENMVGGFFLAWIYLKSETITIDCIKSRRSRRS